MAKKPCAKEGPVPEHEYDPNPISLSTAADMLMAKIHMPHYLDNKAAVEAAIKAETGRTKLLRHEVIGQMGDLILLDAAGGVPINKYYFQDAKWRNPNVPKLNRAEQRQQDNLAANAQAKQFFRDRDRLREVS